jgi:magnesium transporter
VQFHFRPTPHPQNVRRRIKQLKDYISVTSDWISYALIDDITDAFGPLIQSIEYEVDSIDELVLILKEAEQSDMLRRIGRCRKKVMGLLRLMGNKADVVKGLAKRCNENWKVAPTSDIVRFATSFRFPWPTTHLLVGTVPLGHSRSLDHDDSKFEPLRKNFVTHTLELFSPNQYRDDGREQPDQ